MSLKVYNSLTRQKETFQPINPPYVGMYVCGPTVSGESHLGHARPYVTFDVLYRYLMHLGYKVRYVRNLTDAGHFEEEGREAEDKISKKAVLEKLEPMELVHKYTNLYHWAMDRLNNLTPAIEPTATGHIIEQIEMIKKIIAEGYAYAVNGSVYFDVEKYNTDFSKKGQPYGILSGRILEDQLESTRDLDNQDEKRNKSDFALWKNAPPEHIMRWQSPWGVGFPGWHIECSAMSTKYLGPQFDIHGGGMDLQFPVISCTGTCETENIFYPGLHLLFQFFKTAYGQVGRGNVHVLDGIDHRYKFKHVCHHPGGSQVVIHMLFKFVHKSIHLAVQFLIIGFFAHLAAVDLRQVLVCFP